MLILSRKAEESIMIGETIKIKILGVQDGQVKIGIDAPKEIKVYRSELYEQIHKENIEASKTQKETVSQAAARLRQNNEGGNRRTTSTKQSM
jgi:carbon storage regulator